MIKLPTEVQTAISCLEQNGFEAYAVGGCVRDMLRGEIPHDYDVTTNALPDEIKNVFKDYKTIDTGIAHGTVTAVINHFHIEITTYRVDGTYTDNRHPDCVRFTSSLADDLARRDFTVNAMAYNPTSGIADMYGSAKDLSDKIIRCVGDAGQRFDEDALRILRALRFAAVLGFEIEPSTAKAIHEKKTLLKNIAAERILSETKKLMCGRDIYNILIRFRDVFEIIFADIAGLDTAEYAAAAKAADAADVDLNTRLGAFLYFCGDNSAADMLRRLKSDNATLRAVRDAIACCKDVRGGELTHVRSLVRRFGYDTANTSAAMLKSLFESGCKDITADDVNGMNTSLKKIRSCNLCCSIGELDVNGNDIISNNIARGTDIGKMLNILLDAVTDEKIPNTKDELLKYARLSIESKGGNPCEK